MISPRVHLLNRCAPRRSGRDRLANLAQSQLAGARVPEPQGLVRGTPVGQVLYLDADQGVLEDRQAAVPVREVRPVSVDLGEDVGSGGRVSRRRLWRPPPTG